MLFLMISLNNAIVYISNNSFSYGMYMEETKKSRKKFIFINIKSNVIIGFMLAIVFAITFIGGTTATFNQSLSTPNYKAIYNGNQSNKKISLMFNVYQGTEYITPILEILSENKVKATFFVGGVWVSSNKDKLKEIYLSGNEIGNHGYLHKDHGKLSYEDNLEEINVNHTLVESIFDYKMTLFAPPCGSYKQNTLDAANNLNYKTIMWSKDTIDWRDHNKNLIISRATKSPSNGDLILMHPTKQTVEALNEIIKFYLQKEFEIVTVSENLL